jgi:hypothetical protein
MFGIFGKANQKSKEAKEDNTFKSIEPSNSLIIRVINGDTINCREELGITEERHKELCRISIDALEKNIENGKVVAMAEISTKVTHVNELYMCMLIVERAISQHSGPSEALADLLSKLFGPKGK